jgi:isopentenyl-diphosphate Delta-isomerase
MIDLSGNSLSIATPDMTTKPISLVEVDENGQTLGEVDLFEAHRYPGRLHRAVSVWLVNSQGQTLLQQRSDEKIVGAGWWGNAICGNVRSNESEEACARRRLLEEIGIVDAEISPIYSFNYRCFGNDQYGEFEHDQVYVGVYEGSISPNPTEVSRTIWHDANSLLQLASEVEYPDAPTTLSFGHDELRLATKPKLMFINQENLLFSPWTLLMLRDLRLKQALMNLA